MMKVEFAVSGVFEIKLSAMDIKLSGEVYQF